MIRKIQKIWGFEEFTKIWRFERLEDLRIRKIYKDLQRFEGFERFEGIWKFEKDLKRFDDSRDLKDLIIQKIW